MTRCFNSRSGLLLLAVAVSFAACGEHEAHYTPDRDDAAMGAVASAWAEPGGLAVSLCEDTARSAEWSGPSGCQVDHVVRGGGLGLSHSEERGDGCGGCPYAVVAYVRGTASAPGLGTDVPVSGEAWLGSSRDDDPYGLPWRLALACDEGPTCAVTGEVAADGSLAATLVIGPSGPGQAETHHPLARVGAAACP